MSSSFVPARLRRVVAVLATGSLALAAPVVASGVPSQADVGTVSTSGADEVSFTVVQANLQSPQSGARFQQDARTVMAQEPDVITYNEVAFRYDKFLAPPGYELWRTPGQYTGPTPVAWRTSVFTKLGQGTRQISNYQKKPPGRSTKLGLRYANWVTLQDKRTDRKISVVSAHVPPPVNGMPDLRHQTVRKIGDLVSTLAARGPVVVGGDFNLHFKSKKYPKGILDAAGMVPTYESLGTMFPTGNHQGATIDYVFLRGEGQVQARSHAPVALNSDHDAVVAQMSWTGTEVDTPTNPGGGATGATRRQSRPNGTRAQQRVVVDTFVRAVKGAKRGGSVEVSTAHLGLPAVAHALRQAQRRGVAVRLVTRSPRMTPMERRLRADWAKKPGSRVERCVNRCARSWTASQPKSVLLVREADRSAKLRVDTTRQLGVVVRKHSSVVRTSRDPQTLAATVRAFRRS